LAPDIEIVGTDAFTAVKARLASNPAVAKNLENILVRMICECSASF
jgi:hypothetical protein